MSSKLRDINPAEGKGPKQQSEVGGGDSAEADEAASEMAKFPTDQENGSNGNVSVLSTSKAGTTPSPEYSKELVGGTNSRAKEVLLNEDVLPIIGKHISAMGLMSLRQTNTVWNKCLIQEFRRKHAPIKLYNFSKNQGEKSMSGFIEMMKLGSGIPFGNFNIVKRPTSTPDTSFINFFAFCGNLIKKLELTVEGPGSVKEVYQAIFAQTPELIELKLNLKGGVGVKFWNENGGDCPTKELTKLKKLDLSGGYDDQWSSLVSDLMNNAVSLEGLIL